MDEKGKKKNAQKSERQHCVPAVTGGPCVKPDSKDLLLNEIIILFLTLQREYLAVPGI
jgi:hypothetical protein